MFIFHFFALADRGRVLLTELTKIWWSQLAEPKKLCKPDSAQDSES